MRWMLYGVLALVALNGWLVVDYYLPSKMLVRINSAEYRELNQGPSPDRASVSHIYAAPYQEAAGTTPRPFRNIDTRFGWPFYYKFDSGDVHALAADLAQADNETQQRQPALIVYYGWRITFLDLYPNVVSIHRSSPDASTFPIAKTLVMALLLAGVVWIAVGLNRFLPARTAARAAA